MSKFNKAIIIISGKFMKNTGWLLFEQIFRMILSLIVTALMARYLGIHNFGLISYGAAYVAIFTVICKLGMDSILVNEIINKREDTGQMLGTTIILRLVASLLSIVVIFVIMAFLNPNNNTLQIVVFIQSISLLFISFDIVAYWFQSNLQSKYAVISKIVAYVLIAVWRVVLIYFKASVTYFAFATILEAIVVSVLLITFYYKFKGQKLRFSFLTAKMLISRSYHLLIANLIATIYTQMDKIMLGQLASESTVGIYTAAMTISSLWMFIPNALIESARPLILTAKINDNKAYIKRYKQLNCSIIWIGILASVFIYLFSKSIIFLVFGEQFADAVVVLAVLIWSRTFSLLGSVRSIWLISENLKQYHIYFIGIGAILNVILNLTLIPRYGAIGAAIAAIIAEVVSSTLALLLFKQTRPLFKLIVDSFLFKGVIGYSAKKA
ncbi:flippase [Paenibacillus sp. PL91]|uniref:flippase n=1 Tax=Paenibacillus sp. PL91 TaxID=2729538 RepID=UPI00145D2510|nr:flippase [Paenibacillus sp. PL91]MBC9202871.1 flippase [Paenibacillus sp. PL91]